MKKALLGTLALAFCLGSMNMSAFAQESKVTDLTITAEDVNVQVVFSKDDTFSYDYDDSKVTLTAEQTGSSMKITIDKNADADANTKEAMVTVSVPDHSYEMVDVSSSRSGLSLPALDADLKADVNMGSFSLQVPPDLKKTYDCKIVGSAASIDFENGASDYAFKATLASVAPSFPESWPEWPWHGDYEYQDGTGDGKINLDAENSSLSVAAE